MIGDTAMAEKNCTRCGEPARTSARFCIHCGAVLPGATVRNDEGPRVKGTGPSDRSPKASQPGRIVFMVIATIAFIGAGVAFFQSLPFHPHPLIERQPVVEKVSSYGSDRTDMEQIPSRVENGEIIVSLADVKDHRMVGFEYTGGMVPRSLVAYVSPEGKLVTAIAFCEGCNSERYHAQDNTLICNTCGTTWKLQNLEGISGSCQRYPPDPIPSVVVGDEVRIDEASVREWKSRI